MDSSQVGSFITGWYRWGGGQGRCPILNKKVFTKIEKINKDLSTFAKNLGIGFIFLVVVPIAAIIAMITSGDEAETVGNHRRRITDAAPPAISCTKMNVARYIMVFFIILYLLCVFNFTLVFLQLHP